MQSTKELYLSCRSDAIRYSFLRTLGDENEFDKRQKPGGLLAGGKCVDYMMDLTGCLHQ